MKRTFIAIKITPEQPLLNLISELREKLNSEHLKWVEVYNLHLTLHFIGETSPDQVKAVSDILQIATKNYPVFKLNLIGTGYFGTFNRPAILHVNIENNNKLQLIVNDIAKGLTALGLHGNLKSFSPHLTLARIKQLQNLQHFHAIVEMSKEQYLQSTKVTEIIYYESILLPAGPVYKPIQVFKLK